MKPKSENALKTLMARYLIWLAFVKNVFVSAEDYAKSDPIFIFVIAISLSTFPPECL
jgi:hypothetical protein